MWHKMIKDHDPAEEFVSEADLKKYILGEPTPTKPYGFYKDGGILKGCCIVNYIFSRNLFKKKA